MPTEAGQPNNQTKWYEPTKDDDDEMKRAGALITETASIEQYQSAWHELNLWNATLFCNRELIGFNWGVVRDTARELWPANLRTENLIQEAGEALASKASSSPLRPSLLPMGNSWKTERAVRVADQFVDAVWRQTHSEDACIRAFMDAFISSVGAVQDSWDEDTKSLSCEPIFFDQIVIDNRECINRQEPRTVRIRKVLPRASIEAKFKQKLGKLDGPYLKYREVGDGWDVLVEAYRRPDSKGQGGRHTIACAGKLLVDDPWKKDWIPIEFYHYRDRLSGFFMQSGVEELVPYQIRQNELNDAIRESEDIACRPRLTLQANGQIDLSEWDNEVGRICMWSGSKPEPFVWQIDLQPLYQERERNKTTAFSHIAQSEMFTNADLPQQVRLDSSAGVREFRNMEDSRHLRQWTRFEDFRLRVAKMHMHVLGMHKSAAAYTAIYHPYRAYGHAKVIPYEALRVLNDDQYTWTMQAVPLSSQSAAARRELIRDYASRGGDYAEQAKRMQSNPNLEREEALEMACYDDIYRHIDLLEEEKYEAPSEYTDLTYGIKQVRGNMHRLKTFDDVPPVIIANHIKWFVTAISIQQAALQAQQQMQAQAVPFAPTQGMPGTSAAMPHTMVTTNNY